MLKKFLSVLTIATFCCAFVVADDNQEAPYFPEAQEEVSEALSCNHCHGEDDQLPSEEQAVNLLACKCCGE